MPLIGEANTPADIPRSPTLDAPFLGMMRAARTPGKSPALMASAIIPVGSAERVGVAYPHVTNPINTFFRPARSNAISSLSPSTDRMVPEPNLA